MLRAGYLDLGGLTHVYATTIHKAQGLTVDTALVLGGDTFFREAAYTALSRGRTSNRLYLAGETEIDREPHSPETDRTDTLATFTPSLRRSEAKQLAVTLRRRAPTVEIDDGLGIDLGP